MAKAAPALTLSTTEFVRPLVVIDGESYEMRSPEELTAKMTEQLMEIEEEIGSEGEDDSPKVRVGRQIDAMHKGLSIIMPDLPAEVEEKLTFGMQLKIVQTFSGLMANGTAVSEGA